MDVRTRIGKAASVFQKMRTVWRSGTINRDTKIRLYSALVLPVVLYASETWKTTAKTTKQLNVFHRRCLRSILNISWRDHVRNEEVMRMAGSRDLEHIIAGRRGRLAGHILRLPNERTAKTAVNWVPEGGRRKRGRPRNTWRRTLNEDLERMGLDWDGAEEAAGDRVEWRRLVDQCSDRNRRN